MREEGAPCLSEGCLQGEVMEKEGNEEGDALDEMRAERPILNTRSNTDNR